MAEKLFRRFSFEPGSLFRRGSSKKKKTSGTAVSTPRSSTEDVPSSIKQLDDNDERFHDDLYAELRARSALYNAPLTPIIGEALSVSSPVSRRPQRRLTSTAPHNTQPHEKQRLGGSRLLITLSDSTDYLQKIRRRGAVCKEQDPRDHHAHGFHDRLIMGRRLSVTFQT